VALAVELADELADGAKGAALPLITHDLGLSYGQVGLLASVPLLVGGVLEFPLGILAGAGERRRRFILGGGIIFVLSLLAVASAPSWVVLMAAYTVFFPASGAFVSLTQAELLDADPDRQAQVMARWDLAGNAGAVAGPLLLVAVLAAGGGWRVTYLALAGLAGLTWLGTCWPAPARGPSDRSAGTEPVTGPEWPARVREVLAALRDRAVLRWLILLQVADLLVDVLTGFLALYLVNVVHLRPEVAALAIAIRLGAALAGDAILVVLLGRVTDGTVLRASAVLAALAYPGFLLAPGPVAKLALLAVLSAATAPWYPLLQARLFGSLPGRSSVAVTLTSAAGLAGGLGPLAVGLMAGDFGLSWALGALSFVPVAVLAGSVGVVRSAGSGDGDASGRDASGGADSGGAAAGE
jgi:FSR family fosmidomycin resistance protein-like MFS transporter